MIRTEILRPFVKWAGGKGQLLSEIRKYYPFGSFVQKYIEPFVGGGAVFFDIVAKYDLKEIHIADINKDLINAYRVVRDAPAALISELRKMHMDFLSLDESRRKKYYNDVRSRYNSQKFYNGMAETEHAALFIFLNKTCFNGLYRINKNGDFNVPMGRYKNPLVCDENNIKLVSKKLKGVKITCGDYRDVVDLIDKSTFVYLDPPYRPISKTSNFTAYTAETFGDDEQIKLAEFVGIVSERGGRFLLSNSDPQNENSSDDFFERLYGNYKIRKVDATRMINSNGNRRGKIKELFISNF